MVIHRWNFTGLLRVSFHPWIYHRYFPMHLRVVFFPTRIIRGSAHFVSGSISTLAALLTSSSSTARDLPQYRSIKHTENAPARILESEDEGFAAAFFFLATARSNRGVE